MVAGRQPACADDAGEIALEQGDARALDGDIGAGAHSDADIGGRKRRSIIDPVARHGHDAALLAELHDHRALLVGQHLRFHILDAEAPGNGLCGGTIVAGQHDDAHAILRQQLERLRCGGLDRVGDRNHRGELAVDGEKDGGSTVGAKSFGLAVQIGRIDPQLMEKFRVAETYASAIDRCRLRLCPWAS